IVDDDGPAVFFAHAEESVSEGAGKAAITLRRSGALDAPASVQVSTLDGTATAPGDYVAFANRVVTFAAGVDTAVVNVKIVEDLNVEGDETFSLTPAKPTGAGLGTQKTATITIVDND